MNAFNKRLNLAFFVLSLFFIFYLVWWFVLNLYFSPDDNLNNYFTDSYGVIAGIGGIIGYYVAKKWGGFKSTFGRSLSLISIGLFFQFLGQISYAVYFYVYHIDNPYPSFGEIFYFGSIPIYIYGTWLLGKAIGVKFNFKSVIKSPVTILLPILMLVFAYKTFLRDYEIDPTAPLTTFLDIGYPIGQAIFVSLAALIVFNSRTVLGGVMKRYVLFFLYAFIFQYLADTMFLYNTINETWRAGGFDDFLFIISYFWMGLSLFKFLEAEAVLSGAVTSKLGKS